MDSSNQRSKKRRTRRNLDSLRNKYTGVKNYVNPKKGNIYKLKNVPKYTNQVITNERLTLARINKTIKSKTMTRAPLSRIINADTKTNTSKAMSKISIDCSNQSQKFFAGVSVSSPDCGHKNNITFKSSNMEELIDKNMHRTTACGNELSDRVALSSPSHDEVEVLENSTSEEYNNRHRHSPISSCSSSETEDSSCLYEKIMNNLPHYLKVTFPTSTTGSFMKKKIALLKQTYLDNCYRQKEKSTFHYIETPVDIFENRTESIIQNPIDYINIGSTWQESVQEKQIILVSNSSSPSSTEFESNTSDNTFFNSPEYLYFPHKLNQ